MYPYKCSKIYNSFLEYPQAIPLRLPSVDNATPTGAIHANDGKALFAKVIATAGDARNSSFVISVKYAIFTNMYNMPQNRIEAKNTILGKLVFRNAKDTYK